MYFLKPKEMKNIQNGEIDAANIKRLDRDLNIKNRHIVTDNETSINHGQRVKITELVSGANSTINVRLNDYNIAIKDVVVSRGVQLPDASLVGIGKLYVIKDMSGSAAATTIAIGCLDGQTIDGDTSDGITTNYGVKRYVSDGSNWGTW